MTSEEPGMSVRAPATRPPVQDSAVAIVSLRIRHKASSERERARASLPLILFAPGQADGGARGRGDAFLAPGKAEPLAGRGLHGDPGDTDAGDLGDARAHGVAQRSDLRTLADHRDLEIRDTAAARGDAIDGVFKELVGGGALPFEVARLKMLADIAVGQCPEDGVDHRMQPDVTAGMGEAAAEMRHGHPAIPQIHATAEGA